MSDDLMPCPCTMVEQDESCPVGYPSLLCDICNGIGNVAPADILARIDALEAEVERLKEAERTAWERGRDAAANAALEWARTYHMVSPDAIIRALTPEASHD